MRTSILSLLLVTIILQACKGPKADTYDFPEPVDTSTRPIDLQEKKVYTIDGVYADNRFDGARLNGFEQISENAFEVTIAPENSPINPSPWYAFKLWSDDTRQIELTLDYGSARHRYYPKTSNDGRTWEKLPASQLAIADDTTAATLTLTLDSDTLWLAGQELHNSGYVQEWAYAQALHEDVTYLTVGESKLGRSLFGLDIHQGEPKKKETIVVLSRQHPPEVTGYLAMQAFIEKILDDTALSTAFRQKYRLLVFPLMNPDGVDLGHWRHNAGGIDLNRDWAYYRQPETRQVANFVVREIREQKSDVILGIDFHSTWADVFYTKTFDSVLPGFKNYWLNGIQHALTDRAFVPNDSPADAIGRPTSSNWFYTQFGAEGITYEVGDGTDREFIQVKGETAAVEMMQLLIYR